MARGIWKGNIAFGLIEIPVQLHSAEAARGVKFRLIDQRNFAPVGYEKINKKSGEPVPQSEIVRGFEYQKNKFAVITDADFERIAPKATQTIDILDFVDASRIEPVYFERPYYIEPLKKNSKAYALLREIMIRTNKAAVAKIVLRSRGYLAAIVPHSKVLVLELLRYADELRDFETLELPALPASKAGVTERELKMAEQLVEQMVVDWEPERYKDEHLDELHELVKQKAKAGGVKTIEGRLPSRGREASNVLDLAPLLARSLSGKGKAKPARARRPVKKKRASAG